VFGTDRVAVDARRIGQVLSNSVRNAISSHEFPHLNLALKSGDLHAHLSPEYMREQMRVLDDSLPFVCRLKDAKAGKSKQSVSAIKLAGGSPKAN